MYTLQYVVSDLKDRLRNADRLLIFLLSTSPRNAGGETYAYYDSDRLKIFVLVRFPLMKLILFADTNSFKMLLDPILLEAKCKLGDPENRIKPFEIGQDPSITKFSPYEHIYTKYVSYFVGNFGSIY